MRLGLRCVSICVVCGMWCVLSTGSFLFLSVFGDAPNGLDSSLLAIAAAVPSGNFWRRGILPKSDRDGWSVGYLVAGVGVMHPLHLRGVRVRLTE